MKYYKIVKNNKVIDVLDRLIYLKYQEKHKIMIRCDINEAQAILSSDAKYVWHVDTLYRIPVDGYDTVELVEIDKYEYDNLRILNLKTSNEIIDCYTKLLFEKGVL